MKKITYDEAKKLRGCTQKECMFKHGGECDCDWYCDYSHRTIKCRELTEKKG